MNWTVYFPVNVDLATGATIVCTFGLALIIMTPLKPILFRHAVS